MTDLLLRVRKTLDDINPDDHDPYGFWGSDTATVRRSGKKYDALDMAMEDLEMFFDPEKATKQDVIRLLGLCDDLWLCFLDDDDFIIALMTDDKPTARLLRPQFDESDADESLV